MSAPLFVNEQEINFFNGISKELIQKIVGQKITYYSISQEHTKVDDLYNEAIRKTVWQPVEINALILYQAPEQTNTGFGVDTLFRIEIYFHKAELLERKVVPREGDFTKFGEVMYEIESLTEPQIVFGQINNKVMLKATCRVSRESQFDIKE